MIAFNKELLENTVLVNEAQKLKNSGFISKDQLNAIVAKLPILKHHKNLLVRIGFFLLGCFLQLELGRSFIKILTVLGMVLF